MKRWLVFFLIVMLGSLALAEKLGILTEVLIPEMIEVSDNEIYVVEGASIFIYSLKDLSFIRKFGQKGEGPGELKVNAGFTNILFTPGDSVLFLGIDKAIRFAKTGQVIKEFRIPPITNYLYPIGKNYVGVRFKAIAQQKPNIAVVLFNQEMEEIKELYAQPMSGGQQLLDLTNDALNISIYKDKIFIDQSPKGFVISVLDANGNQLYHIQKEYKKIKFTEKHKEMALNRIKQDKAIRAIGWENLKSLIQIIHGDYLPPIRDLTVTDERIYVKTSHKQGDKDEFIIMDLKGNILKKVYLPGVKESRFGNEVLGRIAKFYKIYKNKYYYLYENEEEEEWEVHVTPIK
ncbi:MAG: hypothetical protein JSV88_11280 [Candidatus Aminicenantes bacterium]|nr:MAG: hypothetical protein JSV88_11280 [Candidatus Aminicenantes bacterium]